MNSAKLHDWLQIVGLAAVVGSLIFVGLQVKQADDIAFAEQGESSSARGVERRALIAEHADIWRKACLGSDLTETEKVIAGAIYINFAQASFNAWASLEATGILGSSSNFVTDRFAANIHRYPGFMSMVQSFGEWDELGARKDGLDVDKFKLAIDDRLQELRELEPIPSADVMWCGIY